MPLYDCGDEDCEECQRAFHNNHSSEGGQMTSHSYHVVMIDHGKRGLEAIVKPERTRRDIVDMVRKGELRDIAFIHHVDYDMGIASGRVEDVTQEILDAAELMAAE